MSDPIVPKQPDVCVVGAGVIGLTVSLLLLKFGVNVTVIAEGKGRDTCSANAGAIWGPFLSEDDDRVFDWSFRTLEKLRELAEDTATGVGLVEGVLAADYDTSIPDWFKLLNQDHKYDEKLPPGYLHGWRYTVPIVDVVKYLEWLEAGILDNGGIFVAQKISNINDISDDFDYVVNCSGLGARELCGDSEVFPVKGQLVIVKNPGIDKFFAERGDLTNLFYWMPQGDKVVLGGTAEETFAHNRVDWEQVDRIIAKATMIDKRFSQAEILDHRVGFRPCRPLVRFDFDDNHPKIFHNYGHGGSGISLSWGCALDVLKELNLG